jgi:hypothetical protein
MLPTFFFFGVPLRAGLSATTTRLPALASASNEGALWGIRYFPLRAERCGEATNIFLSFIK